MVSGTNVVSESIAFCTCYCNNPSYMQTAINSLLKEEHIAIRGCVVGGQLSPYKFIMEMLERGYYTKIVAWGCGKYSRV